MIFLFFSWLNVLFLLIFHTFFYFFICFVLRFAFYFYDFLKNSIDHHYDPPAPYHVKSYCTAGIDTIKSNSISILSRVVLLLLGSLTGNYLHIKHFHYLPESGIFIILGAIFGKYFKAKRACNRVYGKHCSYCYSDFY